MLCFKKEMWVFVKRSMNSKGNLKPCTVHLDTAVLSACICANLSEETFLMFNLQLNCKIHFLYESWRDSCRVTNLTAIISPAIFSKHMKCFSYHFQNCFFFYKRNFWLMWFVFWCGSFFCTLRFLIWNCRLYVFFQHFKWYVCKVYVNDSEHFCLAVVERGEKKKPPSNCTDSCVHFFCSLRRNVWGILDQSVANVHSDLQKASPQRL